MNISVEQDEPSTIAPSGAENKRIEFNFDHLAAIVESSDDAIISKDLNGIITSWNKGAERIFGYTADEIIGRPVTTLIPADHQDEEPAILARIRRGERIDHYETIRQRKDGSLLNISLTVSPVKDERGRIIGASKIARDITERKLAERKLAESLERETAARQMAEAATRAKDDFLSALSHELRTPLNPVLLIASDAARDPELPPAIRARFETIVKNVEVEARLIDDLLELTRIHRGKLRLRLESVDVQAVLREAIQTVQDQIDAKGLRFSAAFNAQGCSVLADAVRLQQIFWNVLKNAVKFTPEGGSVGVEISPANGSVQVSISDTGIGMTRGELEHLFEAFSQGEHASSHHYGGLGLGLAISKRLVELQSGTIQATSEGRGHGSRFIIELPLK